MNTNLEYYLKMLNIHPRSKTWISEFEMILLKPVSFKMSFFKLEPENQDQFGKCSTLKQEHLVWEGRWEMPHHIHVLKTSTKMRTCWNIRCAARHWIFKHLIDDLQPNFNVLNTYCMRCRPINGSICCMRTDIHRKKLF